MERVNQNSNYPSHSSHVLLPFFFLYSSTIWIRSIPIEKMNKNPNTFFKITLLFLLFLICLKDFSTISTPLHSSFHPKNIRRLLIKTQILFSPLSTILLESDSVEWHLAFDTSRYHPLGDTRRARKSIRFDLRARCWRDVSRVHDLPAALIISVRIIPHVN